MLWLAEFLPALKAKEREHAIVSELAIELGAKLIEVYWRQRIYRAATWTLTSRHCPIVPSHEKAPPESRGSMAGDLSTLLLRRSARRVDVEFVHRLNHTANIVAQELGQDL